MLFFSTQHSALLLQSLSYSEVTQTRKSHKLPCSYPSILAHWPFHAIFHTISQCSFFLNMPSPLCLLPGYHTHSHSKESCSSSKSQLPHHFLSGTLLHLSLSLSPFFLGTGHPCITYGHPPVLWPQKSVFLKKGDCLLQSLSDKLQVLKNTPEEMNH